MLYLKHDLEKIAQNIKKNTKIIFLCNPNNPTGTILTKEEVRKFLEIIPPEILVVVDEAYYEYVNDPSYTSGVELINNKRVIVLRTFSKIYGLAGLRIGYGIANREIISMLNRVREPFNVNLLSQEAAVAALRDEAHLRQSKEIILEGKAYLYQAFERLNLEYIPSEANFIFVDLKLDSKVVFKALLREGVIVRTGDIFDHPTYIRVTIGTPDQNKRFITSLEKILRELAS